MCAFACVCVWKRENICLFESDRGCLREVCVFVRECSVCVPFFYHQSATAIEIQRSALPSNCIITSFFYVYSGYPQIKFVLTNHRIFA